MELVNLMLIIALLILLTGLLVAIYLYTKLFRKLNEAERELRRHYLKKAKTQASQIVEEASQEALDMLNDSRTLSSKDQALLEAVVKKVSDEQSTYLKTALDQMMQEYKNELQQAKSNNINMLSNISKDIEANTSTQFADYVNTIKNETIGSEKIISKKIDDEYKSIQNEIITYKNEAFRKIDSQIIDLLKKISIEVTEKSISPQDHKDLIIKTLEKAKNDKLFNI